MRGMGRSCLSGVGRGRIWRLMLCCQRIRSFGPLFRTRAGGLGVGVFMMRRR